MPHLVANGEGEPLFTDDELDAFFHKVYKGSFDDGSFDIPHAAKYAAEFSDGISEGYGKKLSEVDYDTPDARMLASLEKNVFQFSGAKTRAEIVSLSGAMRDAQGKLRTFSDFKLEAAKITGEYAGPWLRTEYDNAVGAATMAARWVEEGDSDTTMLVYRTVGDARVREAHRLLDGIARPKDHSFWDTYYPPNGWKCRCDVQRSTITSNRGDIPSSAIDGVPKLFRVNMAKEGLAFPPEHPYYKAVR